MTHLRLSLSHTLPASLGPLSHHSFRCCLLSLWVFFSFFFNLTAAVGDEVSLPSVICEALALLETMLSN